MSGFRKTAGFSLDSLAVRDRPRRWMPAARWIPDSSIFDQIKDLKKTGFRDDDN
jgi:hypothetical protein